MLALSLLMTSSFGIAVSAATTSALGWAIGIASSAGVAGFWWRASAHIRVTDLEIVVGAMHLPLDFVGEVHALEATEFARRIGRDARGDDAYSLLARAGGGIVVHNLDVSDPFKQWVIGSRAPFALENAIIEAKQSR
jgi:hypothetical protein